MADINKTIKDLDEQIAWIQDNDFHKFPGWGHAVLAMKDALELLKAQQPRVLSYDEMKTMIGKPVYVEEPKRNADPHCCWGLVVEGEEPPEEGGYNYPGGVDFNVEGGLDAYDGDLYMVDIGCGWRAWTAEPTDDQRMNTPWKGR